MNAVCTIASKNYLAQALTLGDSLSSTNPEIKFHILLADEKEELDLSQFNYPIIEFKNIGVPFWEDMAFKYDIIEFNTATKPFFMQWLFNEYGYSKLLYIDPDCAVYSSLDYVYDILDHNFIAMTPHIINPQLNPDEGAVPETEHLFDGIFNFGFVGIANTKHGQYILQWWSNRLKTLGYGDRCESLHVDQKWMDYVPSMFDSGVNIMRHYGYNMSHWNFHERYLSAKNDTYIVNDIDELVVFHFSGYDPMNDALLTKPNKQSMFDISNRPDLQALHYHYQKALLNNKYTFFSALPYAYSHYGNGLPISKLNRRLYRQLTKNGKIFIHPFTHNGSFFTLMSKNNLISKKTTTIDINKQSINNVQIKEKIFLFILKSLKTLLGIDSYTALLKGFANYSKYENQLFLLDDIE